MLLLLVMLFYLIGGNAIIDGNLTVRGTLFYINTKIISSFIRTLNNNTPIMSSDSNVTYTSNQFLNGYIRKTVNSGGDYSDFISTSVLNTILPAVGNYIELTINNESFSAGIDDSADIARNYKLTLKATITDAFQIFNDATTTIVNGGDIYDIEAYISARFIIRRGDNNKFHILSLGESNITQINNDNYAILSYPDVITTIEPVILNNKATIIEGNSTNYYIVNFTNNGIDNNDFTKVIDRSGKMRATINGNVDISENSNFNIDIFDIITVSSEKTFTLTAVQASGKIIDGAGTVAITALQDAEAAGLADITADFVTVNVSGDVNFTGSFPVGTTSTTTTVENTFTLTLTATLADGETINGAGNVIVNALQDDAAAELAGITATGTVTVNVSGDVEFTGSFPSGALTTTTVIGGKTLTLSTTLADGETINGAGNVNINTAVSNNQEFVNITSTGTITFIGGVTPASMPTTFVNNTTELTIASAVLTGKTVTGDGDIKLTDAILDGQLFGGITSTGIKTFIGGATPASMPTTFVNNTTELTIASAVLTGKTVNGTGDIRLTTVVSDTQVFGGISSVDRTITFIGGTTPASMPATFVNTALLTITAAVLTGKFVSGAGNLLVTGLESDVYNGANINISGTYEIRLSGNINTNTNFTPPVGGTEPNLVPTNNMTVKGSIISGLTIDNGVGGVSLHNVNVNRFSATDDNLYRNINAPVCTYIVDNAGPTEVTFTGEYKNQSGTIQFNIATDYSATFNEVNADIAEILTFTSTNLNAISSKEVSIIGNGILNLEITDGSITNINNNNYTITGTNLSTNIGNSGYIVEPNVVYQLKATIPSLNIILL